MVRDTQPISRAEIEDTIDRRDEELRDQEARVEVSVDDL